MARIINGTLLVDVYSPTANPGEYTFTDAIYENQADATGSGSLDVQPGFIVYIAALDSITFVPVPGVVHRYKIVSIQDASDGIHLSATIIWDEAGSEVDRPQDGIHAIISENVTDCNYGLPASTEVYSDLAGGVVEASYNADIRRNACHGGETGVAGATGIPGPTGIQGETGSCGDASCIDLYGVIPIPYGAGGYGEGGFGGTGFNRAIHNQGDYTSVMAMDPGTYLYNADSTEYTFIQYTAEWVHNVSENNFHDDTAGNGIFTVYKYEIDKIVSNPQLITRLEPLAWTRTYSDTTNSSNLVSELDIWNDSSGYWFNVDTGTLNTPSSQKLSGMMFEGPHDLSDFINVNK